MPGYTVIRQDRQGRIRGGVCLFLRDNLTGEVLCSYSNGVCEVLIVKVYQLDTIVVVVYRPPDTDFSEFTPISNKNDSVLQNLPAPAPNITLMGDLNFPSSVITWQVADGLVLPRVEGHRVPAQPGNGRLVRQQAANLCDLAVKYSLSQQVTEPTREKEILDLIWSSNPDLVSSIQVESFKDITYHSVVSATTSYRQGREVKKEESYLLDSGKRFKLLDFSKAPWSEIKNKLNKVNWESLETLAEEDVRAAHALFIDTILPVLEELVPRKPVGKRFGHGKVHKKRRCCGEN